MIVYDIRIMDVNRYDTQYIHMIDYDIRYMDMIVYDIRIMNGNRYDTQYMHMMDYDIWYMNMIVMASSIWM